MHEKISMQLSVINHQKLSVAQKIKICENDKHINIYSPPPYLPRKAKIITYSYSFHCVLWCCIHTWMKTTNELFSRVLSLTLALTLYENAYEAAHLAEHTGEKQGEYKTKRWQKWILECVSAVNVHTHTNANEHDNGKISNLCVLFCSWKTQLVYE